MRPIVIDAPVGSLVHAANGAATSMCTTVLCAAIVETAWLALDQAVPMGAQALWARRPVAGMSAGQNPRTGKPFAVIHHFGKGGSGATLGFDGWDHLSPVASMGGSRTPDPELFESRSPHFILHYELRPDSAGPGRWRGGHGAHYRVRFTADSMAIVLEPSAISPETTAAGFRGGQPGPLASAHIERPNGDLVKVESPLLFQPQPGDILDLQSTGGGGYGHPFERPPESVLDDVIAGLLSIDRASSAYGVVIDPATASLDLEATRLLRASRGPTWDQAREEPGPDRASANGQR
jgi:N-methylhydantoinase B